MALTRKVNGSGGGTNIIQASWWNDFVDLLTGAMTDQPVNINNIVTANGVNTAFNSLSGGNEIGGYWIEDNGGTPRLFLYINSADNDAHLQTSPANHRLKITKDTGAYDIAVFDASGVNGSSTFNGSLTVSGGGAGITCGSITLPGGANVGPAGTNDIHIDAGSTGVVRLRVAGVQGFQVDGVGNATAAGALTVSGGGTSITTAGAINTAGNLITCGPLTCGTINAGTTNVSTLNVSGSINMTNNNQSITFEDSTGANTNARVWCDASNRIVFKACTANNFIFQNNSGSTYVTIDSTGLRLNNGSMFLAQGSFTRVSTPSSSTGAAGTFNHNLGATPTDIDIHLTNTACNGNVAVNNITSTQFTVAMSVSGLWWQALAWAY